MDLIPVATGERGLLSTGVRMAIRPRPNSDGLYGRLQAINLETGQDCVGNPRANAHYDRHVSDPGGLFSQALSIGHSRPTMMQPGNGCGARG